MSCFLSITLLSLVISQCASHSVVRRIVGGTDTTENEIPWQAAIRWRVGKDAGDHVCGGSLIHPKLVLTAAHCFVHGVNPVYYNASLGQHELNVTSSREQVKTIRNITIHPSYNEITHDGDLALVELSSPVVINQYVNNISLPQFIEFERPGSICTITGWGYTQKVNGTVTTTNILQKGNVPIIETDVCSKSYAGKISANMFCAGFANGSIDTCEGDSGGPLQCRSLTGKWILNGVTSWGEGCGKQNKYGVYVIVRHYLPWIENAIQAVSKSNPTLTPERNTTSKPTVKNNTTRTRLSPSASESLTRKPTSPVRTTPSSASPKNHISFLSQVISTFFFCFISVM